MDVQPKQCPANRSVPLPALAPMAQPMQVHLSTFPINGMDDSIKRPAVLQPSQLFLVLSTAFWRLQPGALLHSTCACSTMPHSPISCEVLQCLVGSEKLDLDDLLNLRATYTELHQLTGHLPCYIDYSVPYRFAGSAKQREKQAADQVSGLCQVCH